MKRIFAIIIGVVAGCTGCLAEGGRSRVPLADPFIMLDGDTYYAYGTHNANGIEVWTSSDLRGWENRGLALDKANTTETVNFWAPEVYRKNDRYYMYYSANEHLYVATADAPTGPFRQEGGQQMAALLGSEKCIDPSVFFDDDGQAYLFFVRLNDGNCIWMVELESDLMTPVTGTLKKCIAVSQSWENKMGRVNEGPNMVKHDGVYYLTYSGNDYRSQDYAVGYATTTSLKNPSWTKYSGNPIVRQVEGLMGTGHHSLFTDKEGRLRIVMHAHKSATEVGVRSMYIGTMTYSGRVLKLDGEPLVRPGLKDYPIIPEVLDASLGYQRGQLVAVDLNGDGTLDLVGGGSGNEATSTTGNAFNRMRRMSLQTFNARLKRWNTYVTTGLPVKVADAPCIVPCDLNGDGIVDLVAFETAGSNTAAEAYGMTEQGIFFGKAVNAYERAEVEVEGLPFDFDMKAPTAACVADFDGDGRADIVCVGHQGTDCYNLVLRNKGMADGRIVFEATTFEPGLTLNYPIVQAADFNNDGLTDFIVSAAVSGVSGMTCMTDIYLNDPARPGQFSPLGLGTAESGVLRKYWGGVGVADFNADGLQDFYLAGYGDKNTGETAYRQRVYLNKGGERPTFEDVADDLSEDQYTAQSSVANAVGIIDFDGDGHADIVVSGTQGGSTFSQLYLNDGTGHFARQTAMPGVSTPSISFADWDGDGVKDLLLTGTLSNKSYLDDDQQGKLGVVVINRNAAPLPPQAPTDCQAEADGGSVTLSWQAAADAVGNETYEIFVKDATGRMVVNCMSVVGGTRDGWHRTNQAGNAGSNRSITLRLPESGSYTWGVQAVSAAYIGSPFAAGPAFSIETTGISATHGAEQGTKREVFYDLQGRQLARPASRGITIVKTPQGTKKITAR